MTKVMTPSDTDITSGQIGKFQELLGARLRKSDLQSESVQKALASQGDAMADEMVSVVRKHVEAQNVLTFRKTIEVELKVDLDPAAYYRDEKSRLYVYGGFDRGGTLVKRAKPLPAGTKFRLNVHEITAKEGATDEQIETALGRKHLFDETQVCGMYAALMSAQPNGEEGDLLNNGYANIAYLSSCVAHVYWGTVGSEWDAGTWGRGDGRWDSGGLVLSPAH